MKKRLLFYLLMIFTLSVHAQKGNTGVLPAGPRNEILRDASDIKISIYPVPVRERSFTIKCSTDISSVKITNIIGQDIFRAQYKNPQPVAEILLLNKQKRGMYLVTIVFSDGRRVVKKIMIEETG